MTIDDTDDSCPWIESWASGLLIIIAVALHTAALINVHPLQSANDRSRWCTVWSLVERGTFQIDEIRQQKGWDSIDIIRDGEHFYSTKPPLLSVVVAGVTWCVQRITGMSLLSDTQYVTTIVLFFVNIVPFAISLILLCRLLRRVAMTGVCRLFILGAAAFATLITPFLMTLNNHTVAVVGVVVSLYALERILCDERLPAAMFALCGAASAWAVCNELQAASLGLATFLLSWRKSTIRTWGLYVPAALIPLAAFLTTNVVATGSWKPTYAGYGSSKYNFVVDGVPSYWMDPHGVDRNLDSPPTYLLHCTIGHHGMLSLTPLFLLSLVGWLSSRSQSNAFLRVVIPLGAILIVVNLAFFMTRTQNYNYGGVSCGLRWAHWLIPFWLLSLVPVLDFSFRSVALRTVASGLLIASVLSAWIPIHNPWQQPWLFKEMERRGWIDYADTHPSLPRTLWTWFPSIPSEANDPKSPPFVEFSSQQADGSIARRRITVNSSKQSQSGRVAEILVEEATGSEQLRKTRLFTIDVVTFNAGAPVAEFIQWTDPRITPAQQQSDFTFVRGLPLKREFQGGKIVYLKTGMRKDAFRCQLAAAAVDFKGPSGQILRYRCDVWLCDELPFGVVQVDYHVTDPKTKEILHEEQWTASGCHPEVAKSSPYLKDSGQPSSKKRVEEVEAKKE